MWTKISKTGDSSQTAENTGILRTFYGRRLTGRNGEDCYTFEGFASSPDEFRTYYYHYYKRPILGLKEEIKWS